MNLHTATSHRAREDEVTLLAPRTAREPLLVLEGVRPHLDDEQHRSGELLELLGDVRLEDAALGLVLDLRHAAQDAITRRVGQLLGTFFDRDFGFGRFGLQGLPVQANERGFGRANDISHRHVPCVVRRQRGHRLRSSAHG